MLRAHIYVIIYGLAMPAPRPVRDIDFASPCAGCIRSDRRRIDVYAGGTGSPPDKSPLKKLYKSAKMYPRENIYT